MDDFQYIDIYQYDSAVSSQAGCFGPNYHLKMLCKICDSCYGDIYCSNCVKSGSFGSDTKSNGGLTFSEQSKQLSANKAKINALSAEIYKYKSSSTYFEKELSLQTEIKSLQSMISYLKKDISERQGTISNINSSIKRCWTEYSKIGPKKSTLQNHMRSLHEIQVTRTSSLITLNAQLYYVRRERVKELLLSYFPISVSDIIDRVDTIADTPLNIDKIHLYSVPEPTTSSHVALMHMVTATQTVAYLFNVWLPKETRRQLRLCNVISTTNNFPRRDHIARIYLAVSRAVQLICTVCGLSNQSAPLSLLSNIDSGSLKQKTSFSNPPAIVDLAKPLAGLFMLLQSHENTTQTAISRLFDEPYTLLRNDFFGSLQTNSDDALGRLELSSSSFPSVSATPPRSIKTDEPENSMPPQKDHSDNRLRSDSPLSLSPDWEVLSLVGIEKE